METPEVKVLSCGLPLQPEVKPKPRFCEHDWNATECVKCGIFKTIYHKDIGG
jgi:hypothetical protein